MTAVPPAALTPRARLGFTLLLLTLGAAWGLGQPFNKIAVSTGYQPWGIVSWQLSVSALLMGLLCLVQGTGLPRGRNQWSLCVMVAVIGTLVPHWATYSAVRDLPAGVMAVVLAVLPIVSLPGAVALGRDRFSLARISGLACGLAAVLLLMWPKAGFGGAMPLVPLLIALIAPICYATNGNLLAHFGRGGLTPPQLFFASSVIALPAALSLAAMNGQLIRPSWPLSAADQAMILVAVIHAFCYATILWLIGRVGAVFAGQTATVVTVTGIGWSMLLLDERYGPVFWLAAALILIGMALVRPRPAETR